MTAYFTAVSDTLLPDIESGEWLPATLRLKRIVGPIVAPYAHHMTLVEIEDDEADPVFYAGRIVTPVIQSHYDEAGVKTHTTVSDRAIDNIDYQVVQS